MSEQTEERSAANRHLSLKENVVMRLIGLGIFIAPNAGVRFMASVTEGVIEKIGASRA